MKNAVRIRPMSNSEKSHGHKSIVKKVPSKPQVVLGSGCNNVFTFNNVFAPEDTQKMVYENRDENAVKPMVLNLFKG